MASNLGLGTTSSVFRWDVKRPEQKRAKADGFLAFDGYTSDEHLVSDFIACNVCLHNQNRPSTALGSTQNFEKMINLRPRMKGHIYPVLKRGDDQEIVPTNKHGGCPFLEISTLGDMGSLSPVSLILD
jgi:hypothetical protein